MYRFKHPAGYLIAVPTETEALVSVELQQVGVALRLGHPLVAALFTLPNFHDKMLAGHCAQTKQP